MAKRGTKKAIKEKRKPLNLSGKQQVQWLKKLPDDFRNLEPGSLPWRIYAYLMGPEVAKRMEQWRNGPILCDQEPTEDDLRFWGNKHEVLSMWHEGYVKPETFAQLCVTWEQAEANQISYIYLRDWKAIEIEGLNLMASRFGSKIRFLRKVPEKKQ